jgi:hypothetical protein
MPKHPSMNVCTGSGDGALRTDLGTRWRILVNFILRLLYNLVK